VDLGQVSFGHIGHQIAQVIVVALALACHHSLAGSMAALVIPHVQEHVIGTRRLKGVCGMEIVAWGFRVAEVPGLACDVAFRGVGERHGHAIHPQV